MKQHSVHMEGKMKKIPMITLLLAPYVFLAVIVLECMAEGGFTTKALETVSQVYCVMFLLVMLPNMMYAFVVKRYGYGPRELLFWNMLLKICNIPIFVLVFAIGIFMGAMIVGIMLIPFLLIFDYTLLLSSSMYGFSGLRGLSKAGNITKAETIVNGICQLLFVFDVISAVYLYIRCRAYRK